MSWGDGGDPYQSRGVSPSDQIGKLMRLLNWSVTAGHFWGVRIRIHFLFFAYLVYQLVTGGDLLWTLQYFAILFGSVLLHEFGHCAGCRSVGGKAEDILLWPLGGLARVSPPHTPWANFVTVACGPLVNVVLAAGAYLALAIWQGTDIPVGFNPFSPWINFSFGPWVKLVSLCFIINYYLLLFNLALAFYPFDGGRLIQVAMWYRMGYGKSMYWAARIGMFIAIGVAVIAFLSSQRMLVFIAIFGLFECMKQLQQLRAEAAMGVGFMPDVAAASAGPSRHDRREAKALQRRIEESKKRRIEIDRILTKVSDHGLQSLTKKEKKLLQQDTDRLRKD